MTQKELSYFEDAIKHEDNVIEILNSSLNYLKDESLISFFNKEIKNHTNLREKLYKKLEELS